MNTVDQVDMHAANKITVDKKVLQEFVPLNALSPERFREVSEKIIIEEVLAGRYLFRKGDNDNQTIYLLEGSINLIDGFRKVTGEVEAGTDMSRYAISNQQPRSLSARAVKKCLIARIDSGLLDVFLTWDQSSCAEVVEIGADHNQDWMTRILQTEAFIKIPPAMIQSLLIKMQSCPVKAGDVVIRQGDPGDYFYTIHEGRCVVTRKDSPESEAQFLAELGSGNSFGEDALVSDARRNATITMLTNGLLMRLAKEDFIELLKNQLVQRVNYEQAAAMVEEDAVWVDVRTPDEYESGSFEDSVNMPLASLRDEMSELVFNTKYIICCDTGRRSESAGFLLSHKGFDVYVLEGGMPETTAEMTPVDTADTGEPAAYDEELESLRAENERLLTEIRESRSAEVRMTEQLEQLRGEPGESGDKLGSLYAQAQGDTDEVHVLQDQYAALQGQYADMVNAHKLELEQLEERLNESRSQADTARDKQQELEQQVASGQAAQQEIQQLQDALTQANERVLALESDVVKVDEAGTTLLNESESRLQEQQALVEQLRAELSMTGQQMADYQEGVRKLAAEREVADGELGEKLQQQTELSGKLQSDLDGLQHDNDKLRTELREASLLLEKHKEDAGKQQDARQASEDALQEQQAKWESERATLQQAMEGEQHVSEELRRELEQVKARAEESRGDLEKEQQENLDQAREQIEHLESINVKLMNEQSSHAEELEVSAAEREQLQQTLNAVIEEKSLLESEVESLKGQVAGFVESSAEELQMLQEQFSAEQARSAGLEQLVGDKEVQVRDLQQEILQSGEARNTLEQELETLRQRYEEGHSQLELHAERARELEQERDEAIQKAHEDLMRKNDNEKELQGQINRLRKKLEQSTTDQREAREGSQADIDNIRDELHAERQARAEERAQMAARQRELKEQLGAIAVEHEANMTNQSGAIEQARHAGREEEQERLRDLLEAQGQSEEQMLALQQELQKAHAEIAELTRQEKDRRQVDLEMMQEQNQQAVSTITQLESQLKQLTQDRDTALHEQQTLREKMNALRGEVEVSRGLMNVGSQGQVEDPEKLRHELDESKKNVAIALRLRAEAEAARDRLIEERNALRQKYGEETITSTPLRAPSLAADKTEAGRRESQQGAAETAVEATREQPEDREQHNRQPPLVTLDKASGKRRWLGAAIGLGVVAGVVLGAWLLAGSGDPLLAVSEVQNVVVEEHAGSEEQSLATTTPVIPASLPVEAVKPPVEASEVEASEAVDFVTPSPVVAGSVATNTPEEIVTAGEPGLATESAPVSATDPVPATAIRSFRDGLGNDSQGPEMVALPAAEYLMGSPGASLNYDEIPRHKVTLSGFSISKNEVTFAEYDKFARATGRRLPYDESWGRGERPVINVSWGDAQAYAAWLSKKTGKKYRLPTEAEWEYAARAGSSAKVWWDSKVDIKPANCFNCGSEWDGNRTAPAGSFKANDFGLHDMAGNVQEWTEDCYHKNYTGASEDGSARTAPGCTQRVVRGGGYTSPLDSLRNAKRGQYNQDARLDNLGFRVVRSN